MSGRKQEEPPNRRSNIFHKVKLFLFPVLISIVLTLLFYLACCKFNLIAFALQNSQDVFSLEEVVAIAIGGIIFLLKSNFKDFENFVFIIRDKEKFEEFVSEVSYAICEDETKNKAEFHPKPEIFIGISERVSLDVVIRLSGERRDIVEDFQTLSDEMKFFSRAGYITIISLLSLIILLASISWNGSDKPIFLQFPLIGFFLLSLQMSFILYWLITVYKTGIKSKEKYSKFKKKIERITKEELNSALSQIRNSPDKINKEYLKTKRLLKNRLKNNH